MVKLNNNPTSGDPKKVEAAADTYSDMCEEFMCRSIAGMLCPCPVCQVTTSADGILGVVCGAAVKAIKGDPKMLSELLKTVAALTAKYTV